MSQFVNEAPSPAGAPGLLFSPPLPQTVEPRGTYPPQFMQAGGTVRMDQTRFEGQGKRLPSHSIVRRVREPPTFEEGGGGEEGTQQSA